MSLKVVRWVNWEDAEAIASESGENASDEAFNAIVKCCKEKQYKFGGQIHQSSSYKGVPVLSDGCVFFATMRAWGEVMAAVWGGKYSQYAWSFNKESDEGFNVPSDNVRGRKRKER